MVQPGREEVTLSVGGQSVEAFVRRVRNVIDTDGLGPALAAVGRAPDEQIAVGACAVGGVRTRVRGLTGNRANDDRASGYGDARTAVVGE